MADDVFQKHVTALAVKRLEKPKKMSTQNAKYWSEIVNQLYNFDRGMFYLSVRNLIKQKPLVRCEMVDCLELWPFGPHSAPFDPFRKS